MSLLGTISVGSTGLRAAAEAINVVGHNTTNATTEGYSRQRLVTSARDPLSQSGLWIGQGVSADRNERITDIFLGERATSARGGASGAKSAYQAYQLVEASFANERTPSDEVAAFFDALGELADAPDSEAYRLKVIGAGEDLANRVRAISSEMDATQAHLEGSAAVVVSDVNDTLKRIATLNSKITAGYAPDLMDERDRLIGELADKVGATVDFTPEGQATVFIANHAAVTGDNARELTLSADDEGRPVVRLSADKGTITVTDGISGEIGGAIAGWDLAQDVRDDLDTFTTTFVDAFNTQHAAGYDQDGNAGGDFFTYDAANPAGSFHISADLAARGVAAAADPAAFAGDRGNLDALMGLQASLDVSGRTPEDFLSALSSHVGSVVASAEGEHELQEATYADLQQLKDAISGVDLDEEAADLIAWQTAYEAAARLISATDGMIGDLMEMVR